MMSAHRYIRRGDTVGDGRYAMFIGRWQPWHTGHRWLIEQALKEGKKVLICVMDVPISEKNPFTPQQVCERIGFALKDLINERRVKIMVIPAIESVNFGRSVGYSIIEHLPPHDIMSVSATKIRQMGQLNGEPLLFPRSRSRVCHLSC
ncbi:MAG: adenylyltransferase/cytidyltransferase family protein [Verrucomicrobiota bacterium]